MSWLLAILLYCVIGLVVTHINRQPKTGTFRQQKLPNPIVTYLIGMAVWPIVAVFGLGDLRRNRNQIAEKQVGNETRGKWLKLLQNAERELEYNQANFRASEAHTISQGLREVSIHETFYGIHSLREFFQTGKHPGKMAEEFAQYHYDNYQKGTHVNLGEPLEKHHIRLTNAFVESAQLASSEEQARILKSLAILNSEFEQKGLAAINNSCGCGLIVKHLNSDSYVLTPHFEPRYVNLLCWCREATVELDDETPDLVGIYTS